MRKNNQLVLHDRKQIIQFLETKSQILSNYINESKSEFIMFLKYLNHSDLPTFGKANQPNRHSENLLYYLTIEEMINIEKKSLKPFETAHQSNISLPKRFWKDLGVKDPRDTVGDSTYSKRLSEHVNVYLVNEGLEFFSHEYTHKIFSKLEKTISDKKQLEWSEQNTNLILTESDFIEIEITQAVHGLGTKDDTEFHKLRHHIFKNDILIFLIEKSVPRNNLFILPVKNPIFFSLVNESNQAWSKFKEREDVRIIAEARLGQQEVTESYDRRHQDKWRNLLAEEMMNYTTSDYEVFCPFTLIQTRFDELGTLFRASHIKAFKDCDEYEKYDINNGLLLVANADALFDKHLISVNSYKELIFSFLLEQNHLLKSRIMLNSNIFKEVLNEKRMEYLKHHREIFYEKEMARKSNNQNYLVI